MGRLDDDNPELEEGFVFFFRRRLTSLRRNDEGHRQPSWQSIDQQLPPLLIESGGAQIRTTADYAVTFQGSDPNRATTEELEVGVTEKLEGLPRGHPVTLIGRLADGPYGERVFDTERLASGTVVDLMSGERSGARFGLIAGGVLLAVALILVVVAVQIG